MKFRILDTQIMHGTEKGEPVLLGPGDTIELPEEVGRRNPHLEPVAGPRSKQTPVVE